MISRARREPQAVAVAVASGSSSPVFIATFNGTYIEKSKIHSSPL